MGAGLARHQLIHRVNDAFGPDKIAATAASAPALPANADTVDILHAQGLFEFPPGFDIERYRTGLKIPDLNMQIMTAAFQTALKNKIPLSWGIVSGEQEQIQVTTTPTRIVVVLTRVD